MAQARITQTYGADGAVTTTITVQVDELDSPETTASCIQQVSTLWFVTQHDTDDDGDDTV